MVEYFPIKRINIHIDGTLLELVSWREFNFGICQLDKTKTSSIFLTLRGFCEKTLRPVKTNLAISLYLVLLHG